MKTALLIFLFGLTTSIYSKNSGSGSYTDSTSYPYWINMMQDRSINFYSTQSAFNKYWENREITKGRGWKQFKRWEWIAQQVIDEYGNFPNEEKQYQEFLKMTGSSDLGMFNSGFSTCNTQGQWKELGPVFLPTNNTSQINGMGRLNAVVLHPTDTNTFFAGACAGGIWKTTDAGKNWSVYTDSLPTLGVSSIAINPSYPDTMYFGSGDRDNSDAVGYGVFKSTDAGTTWTIMNSGMGNQIVGKLIINPKDPRIILAATNNGVYRSTNSAGSWTRTLTQTNTKDIVFMPGNSDYVYATRSGLFYRSTDNGVNWTQITSGLPTTGITRGVIGVSSLDTTLVYFWTANNSVHQGFYLSRDGGANFTTMSTTPNLHDYSTNGGGTGGQAWYNKAMTIDPTDAGIIYCGGVNVFKSIDTGKTWAIAGYWVNQIHADQHDMVSCPITKRIFAANDGGLYFSRTKGTPWIPVKTGLSIAQIYKLGASRTKKDILITGFQDNGTGNYNKGWFTSRGGDGMDCAVDQEDNRYSYGELYYGQIFRIFNTSTQATIAGNGINGINESGAWNTPLTLREGQSSTMYVGYKNIWRSTNIKSSPPSWTRISSNLGGVSNSDFHAIENCIANSDILYASRSNNTFYISENVNDTTPTWTAITQPVSGLVRIIETDPESENIVYISITNRVYKSLDKGTNWTQINGTLPFNANAILLDTSSKKKGLYVGTFGGGVWYTDTTLNSWKYFSKGIPSTSRITDLEMYYDTAKDCNCNVVYASTYNRGTWYSSVHQDTSLKPIAKLEPYSSILPCNSSPFKFKSNSCNVPMEFKWKFNNNKFRYTQGTDSLSENPVILFDSAGIYNFSFIVENCIGADTLYGSVEVLDTARTVCSSSTTNTSTNFGIGIFDVQLAGSSFPSLGTFQEGGYLNQSCNGLLRLKKGEKYTVYIRTGTGNDEQVKMYIDYDNNGILNDTNELVIAPSGGRTNHTDSFTVPMTALSGMPLRMRVRSDFTSVTSNPCSNLSYGQTEDFVVFIERDSVYPDFALSEAEICKGQTVTFYDSTAIKGGVYLWNFGSGASPSSANTPGPHQVSYNSNGYVFVSLKVNDETITKDSVLHVKAKPEMQISFTEGDTGLCEGENLVLEAIDNNSTQANYQWQFNNSNIQDSIFKKLHKNKITPADSGKYTLIASINGCTDTAVIEKISVHYSPSANFTISDTSQCLSGNSFTFTNSTSITSGNLSYLWNFGDATGSTATSPSKSYNNANTYNVKLVSASTYGCADSLQKNIYIRPQPNATFSINDSSQCLTGNNFTFTNNSSINSGTLSHSWNFGDATGSNVDSPSKSYNSANTYNVKLVSTSNFGCTDSLQQNVYVRPQPQSVFSVNDSDQCLSGNNFTFTNNSSISSGTLSHNWNFGDATGTNADSPSKSYNSANAYNVKLVSTSTLGCTDSLQKSVFVRPQPNSAFLVNDSGQCLTGNDFLFTNNSGIASGTLSYNWDFGDSDTSSTTSPSKSYMNANTYSVKLLATSDYGCKDSIIKTILVHPQPNTAFNVNDSDQCLSGNSFLFTNNSSISSGTNLFLWYFGDAGTNTVTSPVKSYTNSGTYVVKLIVTSNFGCMDSLSKNIQVRPQPAPDFTINKDEQCLSGNEFQFTNNSAISSGNMIFNWNFDDSSSSQSISPNKTYNNAGNYNVKLVVISDFGCKDSISKSLQVWPQPFVDFSINNNEQCLSGNDFNFGNNSSINSGTLSHNWNFGDATSDVTDSPQKSYANEGIYVVKLVATSNFGCKDSLSKNVVVRPQPDFNLNLVDTICKNDNVSFTANSSNNTISYTWKKMGETDIFGGTYNVVTSDAGNLNIRLVVSNDFSCKDSVEISYEVHELPFLNLGNDTSFCDNETFLLILSSGHPGFTNIWNNGKNTDTIQVHQAGTYSVIVTDNMGCENTDNLTVNLLLSPQVDLGSDRLLNPSLQINEQLDAGSGFASYLWNTNDTTQSIIVTQTGDYYVEVSNMDGCMGYDSIIVRYWNETTSTGVINSAEKIRIFPNPTSTVINVHSEEKEMKTIRIYNATGKIIWMQEVNAKATQINSEHWAAGIYTVEIVMPEKTLNFRQAIVK